MLKGFSFALVGLVSMFTAHATWAASVTEMFRQNNAQSTVVIDHSAWDKLLKAYVKPDSSGLNRVDYAAFKANDHDALKAYIKALETIPVATLNRTEQFAFWANLYNAKTVDVILDYYPVTSIRQISINDSFLGFLKKSVGVGGPWKAKIMEISGQKLSLDDIEHAIMRPVFKDPRVHYAVNCASIGCPNLRTNAFTSANLETELNAGAVDYVNSPRGFAVKDGSITASSIYSWFQVDFGGSKQSVIAHAIKYANPKLKSKLVKINDIGGFGYDWGLNDIVK